VRRFLLLGSGLAASLAFGVGTAGATNECKGLNPCVPVAGPWVVVPVANSVPRPQVQYVLTCPKGYVVGGLDAELTDRAIDVAFLGKSGSPVNPGITTSRTAVFSATYVGGSAHAPSFRPHIGCLPGGGGRRTPTAVSAVVPPGEPTVRLVKSARLAAGASTRVVLSCAANERLIAAYDARGFSTAKPPTQQMVSALTTKRTISGNKVVVTAHSGTANAVVQLSIVCAGGQ
jgi:hypothetical protein